MSLYARMLLVCLSLAACARAEWLAYNDCLIGPGESPPMYVTTWTLHSGDASQSVGRLKDFETGNRPPSVDAGSYEDLIWPLHSLQLQPDVYDDDPCDVGLLSYHWCQVSGPEPVSFLPSSDLPNPMARFPEPGVYELQLEVWDDLGQTSLDGFEIVVASPLLIGDLDGNHRVHWNDLVVFSAQWLDATESPANLDAVDPIDFRDLALLAANWGSDADALTGNEQRRRLSRPARGRDH